MVSFIQVFFGFLIAVNADEGFNTGCVTKCSVTFDHNLSCFNKTRDFFEKDLFDTMQNYVRSWVLSGLSKDKDAKTISQSTINGMKKDKVFNQKDSDEMYGPGDAQSIADALAELIKKQEGANVNGNLSCPLGCEESMTPWLPIFVASAALNLVFFILAAGAMLLATKREERQAAKIFQEALITSHGIKKE
ncbi:unnamed protein product, partial [Mesorhabditis spiculigera]